MEITKKRIILSILSISFIIFCFVTLLPHDKSIKMNLNGQERNVTAVKSENNNSEDKFQNLYSFSVKINEEVISLPTSLNDFMAAGWEPTKEIIDDTFNFVPIEHTDFVKEGIPLFVFIDATEDYPLLMDKYYVSTVFIDRETYADYNVELPKGIQLGSSNKKDIIKAYGDPDDTWDYDNTSKEMFYKYDKDQMIILTLDEQDILEEIVLSYEQPKEKVNFASLPDDQEPLTELSSALSGDMFMVDGYVYHLPDKVSELINQGWMPETEENDISEIDEGSVITFVKGDNSFTADVRNPKDQPTSLENCYFVNVSFDPERCDTFAFTGGINEKTTLADLRQFESQYQVKEVHLDLDEDLFVSYCIKTGTASQMEFVFDYIGDGHIASFRLTNFPK